MYFVCRVILFKHTSDLPEPTVIHKPLSTQNSTSAQDTGSHSYLSTWWRSDSVEFLWSWLLSGGFPLWSSLEWESRREVSSATSVPTESGNAETAVTSTDGNSHQSWRCASAQDDPRCPRLSDKSVLQDERCQGDEKAWLDWRYKFRVEASRCFRQAAAVLDWAEDRYDQPISESDIQQVDARKNWADPWFPSWKSVLRVSTCSDL